MIYSQLLTAILAFHNDAEIEQSIPTFIALAEAQMNRALRTREMWGFAPVNMTGEAFPLPDDFLAVETIKGPFGKLSYVSPQMMDELVWPWGVYFDSSMWCDYRNRYTIAGGCIVFPCLPPPAPGTTLPTPPCALIARMRYRKRLAPLGAANPSNWCLAAHPDAYVYGALVQSLAFKADGRGDAWQAGYDKALADIEEADRHAVADTLEMRSDVAPSRHGIDLLWSQL